MDLADLVATDSEATVMVIDQATDTATVSPTMATSVCNSTETKFSEQTAPVYSGGNYGYYGARGYGYGQGLSSALLGGLSGRWESLV